MTPVDLARIEHRPGYPRTSTVYVADRFHVVGGSYPAAVAWCRAALVELGHDPRLMTR